MNERPYDFGVDAAVHVHRIVPAVRGFMEWDGIVVENDPDFCYITVSLDLTPGNPFRVLFDRDTGLSATGAFQLEAPE